MELNVAKNSTDEKILLDVERQILAIIMHSPKATATILSQLTDSDFSNEAHSTIYKTIVSLFETGGAINITQISDKLKDNKQLDAVGGIPYLSSISGYYYTDEGFEDYIEIIFKHSVGRQLDRAIKDIKQMRDNELPINEVFLNAQQRILNIKTEIGGDDAEPIDKTVVQVIKHIQDLEQNPNTINGIPTGFKDLDNMTNGWQKGDFIILAARPSMGKTAFSLNLALNAALKKKGVAFFSLEMPKEQLVQRMLSSVSKVESGKLRSAQGLTADSWKQITYAGDTLKELNVVIDDTPGLNVLQIQAKLRKMKRDYDIEVCFIDYLQLISTLSSNGDNRQNEVATISRQLKKIARELNIPIICLSQLSRSVEKRENKTPIMSDLRDSGAIEQDADIIMFIYREDYYGDKKEQKDITASEPTDIIISKHRNGATGAVTLNFHKSYGTFLDKNQD